MSISFLNLTDSPKIADRDWLANCFMLSRKNVPDGAYAAMMLSTANWKFTDTRIGGNLAINMPPAYTRFADPRASGMNFKNTNGSRTSGLGEYWADQIDENAQIIHLQFGVPTFRGMLSFFSGVSDIKAGLLARTGRVPIAFYVGQVVGFVVGLRLLPFILAAKVMNFVMNRNGSRYYNLKPAMHPYWNRVNMIANMIAVSEGLVDRFAVVGENKLAETASDNGSFERNLEKAGTALEPSDRAAVGGLVAAAHAACPELFLANGGVDVYRIASRYQELANARRKFLEDMVNQKEVDGLLTRIIEYSYAKRVDAGQQNISDLRQIHKTEYADENSHDGTNDLFAKEAQKAADAALQTAVSAEPLDPAATTPPTEPAAASGDGSASSTAGNEGDKDFVPMYNSLETGENGEPKNKAGWFKNWWNGLSEGMKSGYNGGFSWVAFKVNATGSQSASFSNSTTTPEIKSMINGFSSSAAKLRFNFSQGATGIPGIDTITEGVKNLTLGLMAGSGIGIAGLVSLAGSSFVEVPDTWEDSTANLPAESFEIHLRSPYGNVLSRYMNLHIPLSMLLAGALPISTGRQSYTAPFICKMISVGRSNVDLGMIDSLNITHGVGNLGFNRDKKPLGIDVSFTVKDLNRAVHAPIDMGGSLLNPLSALSIFDDDNAFNFYINTLAGVSVADMTLAKNRFDRNLRLKMMAYNSFFSTSHLTLAATESAPGRALRSVASAGSLIWPSIAPGMNKIQG